MKDLFRGLLVVGIVSALLAGYFIWQQRNVEPLMPPEIVSTPPAAPPAPAAEPAPPQPEHHPIEDALPQPATPLPPPAATTPAPNPDDVVAESLIETIGRQAFTALFIRTDLIRHFVVTVDNLPREKIAYRLLPVKATTGKLTVSGSGDTLAIAPANATRYTVYVQLADAINAEALVGLYVRHYALFQQAYRDLGYPDGYFNDRLVIAIKDLLAAPDLSEAPKLTQPSVWYQFADPQLESLSAGQKILVRMGPENASHIKNKLSEILVQLTGKITPKAP